MSQTYKHVVCSFDFSLSPSTMHKTLSLRFLQEAQMAMNSVHAKIHVK